MWSALEQCVQLDPAGRGVAAWREQGRPLAAGQLKPAAAGLQQAQAVGIVTGFSVFDGQGWVAETDGPPGALYLARALIELGIEVALITDIYGVPLLQAGCDHLRLPRGLVREMPLEAAADPLSTEDRPPPSCVRADAWARAFFDSQIGRRMTHLVAIERAGPSHTLDSLAAQSRTGPAPCEEFDRHVPAESRDRCHNMRGQCIDAHTARTHRLFEMAAALPHRITTIGIGDGGNELGMGQVPWETLRRAIAGEGGGKIACRVATDFLLVAGVSNWGAYALAAAVCHLHGQSRRLRGFNAGQRELIETLVRETSAVDGLTRRREPTVDGLPLDAYLPTLTAIQERIAAGE